MATSAQLREQIAAGRWDGPLAALYGPAPQELARQRARYCAALELSLIHISKALGEPPHQVLEDVAAVHGADLVRAKIALLGAELLDHEVEGDVYKRQPQYR